MAKIQGFTYENTILLYFVKIQGWIHIKKGREWAGAVKKGKPSIGAGTVVETTCKHQKRKV